MFLSLDGTFWIQIVNFVIFFAALNAVFSRPVGEAIKKRRAYIDGVRADRDKYVREARELRAQAEQKRGAARRASDETVATARDQAERDAAAIVSEQTARASEIIDRAHATVAHEVAAASGREDALARNLADALLERALGPAR